MAKPIQLDFPARDGQAELQQLLADAAAEHAEAIVDFLELLEVLHRKDVLSAMRGLVGASDDVLGQIARSAAQPESIRAMRNLLAMVKILAAIDPEFIEAVARSIPPQIKDRDVRRETPSVWKLARTFLSPPVRSALFATGFVLAGVGHYLRGERA